MPVEILQKRMARTKVPDGYDLQWSSGDDIPAIENPKYHYLYKTAMSHNENFQENWERIILDGIKTSSGFDQFSPKRFDSSPPEIADVGGLNLKIIANYFSSGGQKAVFKVFRALQEDFVDSGTLLDFRTAIEAVIRSSLEVSAEDENEEDSHRSFFKRVIRLDVIGQTDAALDLLYDSIDELMRNGEFQQLDSFISGIDVDDYSVDILLGILTVTLPARSKLQSRMNFFNETDQSIKDRGEDEEGLLTGLE